MIPVYIHSLSALAPVKLVYNFNRAEELTSTLDTYRNGFSYYKYSAFENFQDAVLSNKTCLILSDNVSLKEIFKIDSKQIDVGSIASCFYLKNSLGKYVTALSEKLYIGGVGDKLLINVIPHGNNLVELKVGNTEYIQVDKEYPYTASISRESLDGDDVRRQQYELDYKDGLICFRTLTDEGWRYLSYGADQTVRAVGLILNETMVNNYLFVPEFVSTNGIHYDFDAKNSQTKYFNELTTSGNRETVNIKQEKEANTNLLISCATAEISKPDAEASVNISITKTNFSSSGSYSLK